jgi:hypothetical protein
LISGICVHEFIIPEKNVKAANILFQSNRQNHPLHKSNRVFWLQCKKFGDGVECS